MAGGKHGAKFKRRKYRRGGCAFAALFLFAGFIISLISLVLIIRGA